MVYLNNTNDPDKFLVGVPYVSKSILKKQILNHIKDRDLSQKKIDDFIVNVFHYEFSERVKPIVYCVDYYSDKSADRSISIHQFFTRKILSAQEKKGKREKKK